MMYKRILFSVVFSVAVLVIETTVLRAFVSLQVHAKFSTSTKTWETSTDRITQNNWHKLELSWSERKGLQMYVDKELVASSSSPTQQHHPPSLSDHAVYIGRPTDDNPDGLYSDAIVDELEYWYADRDQLVALGLLDKGTVCTRINYTIGTARKFVNFLVFVGG